MSQFFQSLPLLFQYLGAIFSNLFTSNLGVWFYTTSNTLYDLFDLGSVEILGIHIFSKTGLTAWAAVFLRVLPSVPAYITLLLFVLFIGLVWRTIVKLV